VQSIDIQKSKNIQFPKPFRTQAFRIRITEVYNEYEINIILERELDSSGSVYRPVVVCC
jgi:hypothetical protein